jgi:hypothetical protein
MVDAKKREMSRVRQKGLLEKYSKIETIVLIC